MSDQANKKGGFLVFSGPSGAGKSTLLAKLKENHPAELSISTTTRDPRGGEQDGVDYYFVSTDEFKAKIDAGEFLEYADVYGKFYGTLRGPVEKAIGQGRWLYTDLDVQGTAQLREKNLDGLHTIFISPPSLEVLEQRLRGRGTDDDAAITKRLAAAKEEMDQADHYDYKIINDDLEEAFAELEKIFLALKAQA